MAHEIETPDGGAGCWVICTHRGQAAPRRHIVPAGSPAADVYALYNAYIDKLAAVLRREPWTYPGRVWLVRPDGRTARDAWFPRWPTVGSRTAAGHGG